MFQIYFVRAPLDFKATTRSYYSKFSIMIVNIISNNCSSNMMLARTLIHNNLLIFENFSNCCCFFFCCINHNHIYLKKKIKMSTKNDHKKLASVSAFSLLKSDKAIDKNFLFISLQPKT